MRASGRVPEVAGGCPGIAIHEDKLTQRELDLGARDRAPGTLGPAARRAPPDNSHNMLYHIFTVIVTCRLVVLP